MRPDTADYRALFLQDTALLDTRAPLEFQRGAFPTATNLPLMTDEERHQVGITYKNKGQAEAIALGHQLVADETRRMRLQQWCDFAQANPDGYLYCFRGGLRSSTVQRWMRDAGCNYPLVIGGYKSMRRFLLTQMEEVLRMLPSLLVGGRTGCGKTRVLHAVDGSIDLEGLARHRGSSFGRLLQPQPAQIDFENALSITLLRRQSAGDERILMEDEGKLVGRIRLPLALRDAMAGAAQVVVDEPLESRVEVVYEDYIVDLGNRYREQLGDAGCDAHLRHLEKGLAGIRKRLGGARHQAIGATLSRAFDTRDGDLHRQWIRDLLVQYYDPMYDYQTRQRGGEVIFRGDRAAVIDYLRAGQPAAQRSAG